MDNLSHGRERANRIYYPTSPPTIHISSVSQEEDPNGSQRHKAEWREVGSGSGGANAEYPEENADTQ